MANENRYEVYLDGYVSKKRIKDFIKNSIADISKVKFVGEVQETLKINGKEGDWKREEPIRYIWNPSLGIEKDELTRLRSLVVFKVEGNETSFNYSYNSWIDYQKLPYASTEEERRFVKADKTLLYCGQDEKESINVLKSLVKHFGGWHNDDANRKDTPDCYIRIDSLDEEIQKLNTKTPPKDRIEVKLKGFVNLNDIKKYFHESITTECQIIGDIKDEAIGATGLGGFYNDCETYNRRLRAYDESTVYKVYGTLEYIFNGIPWDIEYEYHNYNDYTPYITKGVVKAEFLGKCPKDSNALVLFEYTTLYVERNAKWAMPIMLMLVRKFGGYINENTEYGNMPKNYRIVRRGDIRRWWRKYKKGMKKIKFPPKGVK